MWTLRALITDDNCTLLLLLLFVYKQFNFGPHLFSSRLSFEHNCMWPVFNLAWQLLATIISDGVLSHIYKLHAYAWSEREAYVCI